jgi:hypothetical protein
LASAAFGALRKKITEKHIDLKIKVSINVAARLSTLLYGCDFGACWKTCSMAFGISITAAYEARAA